MGKNDPKIKVLSDFLGNLYTSQFKGSEYEFDIDILRQTNFRQISSRYKTSPDLIASLYSRDLEGVECRSDVDVSFDILFKTFNLGKLVLKVKSLVITNMIFDLKMF